MAKLGLFDLDVLAANNGDLAGTSILGTGLVSTADDSFRNLAAFEAQYRNDQAGAATTAGTNTVTVTLATSITAIGTGFHCRVKLGGTNTGAATLNVNSLGAKNIKVVNAAGSLADPLAGQLLSGSYATFLYDGTNMVLVATSASAPATGRNRIVNGAMQVSQENANTAGTTASYYGADQFFTNYITSAGTITTQRVQSVTPNGSKDRYRITITVQDASLAAGEFLVIDTRIEGQEVADLQWGAAAAQQIVVRFGFKGPAGTYSVSLRNSALNRSYVAIFTITAPQANIDTVQTITIPGDTSGTWLKDTGIGIDMVVCLACGSTFQGTAGWQAGNIFGTSGVTNGMGTAAAVFELFDVGVYADPNATGTAPAWEIPRSDDVVRQCQRYWYATPGVSTYQFLGYSAAGGLMEFLVQHPVEMRSNPTGAKAGTWVVSNCGQPSISGTSTKTFSARATVTALGVAFFVPDGTDDIFTMNARL